MLERARFLHSAGYSVLLIDLQATGESAGHNITFGWLESRDVIAAVEFIRREEPGRPIAIIGSSLGGAAALLATPPLQVDALVLEAVYPTIERATENRLAMRLGPLGTVASSVLLAQLRARLGVSAAQLRPVDHVSRLNCPVLIIGGALDRHTTKADTLLLYSSARSPKELWLIEDASHVDFHRARRNEYERRVLSFLRVHLKQSSATIRSVTLVERRFQG
jgi:fermentation-respiration switch protein FrsA (DUF1100 family)